MHHGNHVRLLQRGGEYLPWRWNGRLIQRSARHG